MGASLCIVRVGDNYRLWVHAAPGARGGRIGGEQRGALKVSVIAAADKGRANLANIQLLATAFELKPRQIRLLAGGEPLAQGVLIAGAPEEMVDRVAEAARTG